MCYEGSKFTIFEVSDRPVTPWINYLYGYSLRLPYTTYLARLQFPRSVGHTHNLFETKFIGQSVSYRLGYISFVGWSVYQNLYSVSKVKTNCLPMEIYTRSNFGEA